MTLYVNLADLLGSRIEQGFYRPGDQLPSVRALSAEHGVSLSTVQLAYRLLEDNGLASPRPKSGYFVPLERELPALPGMGKPAQRPVEISQWEQVLELVPVHNGAVMESDDSAYAGARQQSIKLRSCVWFSRSARTGGTFGH